MARDLIIIGCGGFGREVVGIVDAVNDLNPGAPEWNLIGFMDDNPSEVNRARVARLEIPLLGAFVTDHARIPQGCQVIVGIGDARVREPYSRLVAESRATMASLIHPTAVLGCDVEIGRGTVVAAGVQITTNIRIPTCQGFRQKYTQASDEDRRLQRRCH